MLLARTRHSAHALTDRPTIGFGPAEGVAHSLDSAERTSLSQLSIPTRLVQGHVNSVVVPELPCRAIVHHAFSARSSKELELEVDAEVVVTEINTNGWWKGYDGKDLKQKEKMFLGSHVKICNFTHSVRVSEVVALSPFALLSPLRCSLCGLSSPIHISNLPQVMYDKPLPVPPVKVKTAVRLRLTLAAC